MSTTTDDTRDLAALTDAELTAEMRGFLKGKPAQGWHWVKHDGRRIPGAVFTLADGAHAPGEDPRTVLEALVLANRRLAAHRSAAAKKAAATRERRRHLYGQKLALRLANGESFGPSTTCRLCEKPVTDPESIARGVGSDCWQFVMSFLERKA